MIDVIVLCVCAVLSGAEGWCDIEEFGRTKLDWLRRYVPPANGIPVDDTIARIVSALSVRGFQECFLRWMEDVVKLSDGEIIALDGKTHRRAHDRKRGVKALHMVSAWACRNGVVLGQVKTQEKSNEIVAVPELLEKLELKGCIVTLDAMGYQRSIAKQVKEGGGNYVLALKRNQPGSRHRRLNVQTSTSNARSVFRRKMVSPFDPTDFGASHEVTSGGTQPTHIGVIHRRESCPPRSESNTLAPATSRNETAA